MVRPARARAGREYIGPARPGEPAPRVYAPHMFRCGKILASLLVLLAPPLARAASPGGADGSLPAFRVVVSIPPLKGLVAPMLPDGSETTVLCPPGRSEHGFELSPSMVTALAQADIVVLVGLGLEPQVEKAVASSAPRAPKRRILRFADAVGVKADADHHHAEGDDDHDHDGPDPHLWLDPFLVQKFVSVAGDEILAAAHDRGGLSAQQTADFKARRMTIAGAAKKIEIEYAVRLEPFKGRAIVTHHPAFDRLAERFGLDVAATIRATDTGEPTPGSIDAVVRLVRERAVTAVFDEPQSDPAIARRVAAAAGVRVLTLDPLGDGDWAAMMRRNLDALVEGLSAPAPGSPSP